MKIEKGGDFVKLINKYYKWIIGTCIVIGLLLLGRALSEGNSDTGKFYLPVLLIFVGIMGFFQKQKELKKK